MKGVASAMGHSLDLPPQILENCEAAILELEVDGASVILKRFLKPQFEIEVRREKDAHVVSSETEFAEVLLDLLSIPSRKLTATRGHEAPLYAPILLPLFYVDQDTGWNAEYAAPTNKRFIEDQAEELMRLAIGAPARHPFRGGEIHSAKARLRAVETEAENLRDFTERQRKSLDLALGQELLSLNEELAQARAQLDDLQSGVIGIEKSTSSIDAEIKNVDSAIVEKRTRARRVRNERKRLNDIASELGAEIEILATNETAKAAFVTFCANENCKMFRSSDQTFGKQLLYLKDQLKDLGSTDGSLSVEIDRIADEVKQLTKNRTQLLETKRESLAKAGHSVAVLSIQSSSRKLAEAELLVRRRESFEEARKRLLALADEHEALESSIAELTRGSRPERTGDMRSKLEKRIKHWLQVLGTRNIASVELDANFRLSLDDIRFSGSSHHSGSTRTRVVLAVHAALLDVGIESGGHHPKLLLLDAPRQHELHQQDIKNYLQALRDVSAKSGGGLQIVVAATELKLELFASDKAWKPDFWSEGADKPHYLGSPTDTSPLQSTTRGA